MTVNALLRALTTFWRCSLSYVWH